MATSKRKSESKAQSAPQPQPNGVLVSVAPNKQGELALSVQTLGTTTPLEVPALLALAKRQAEKSLGV